MSHPRILCLAVLATALAYGCEKQAPPPGEQPVDAPTEEPLPRAKDESPTQPRPSPAPPAADPRDKPAPEPPAAAGSDPHATASQGTQPEGPPPTETALDGITFKVPEGWVFEVPSGPSALPDLAPKASFRLPAVEGDPEDVLVRITHFPGMKGLDEMNLERWCGMFTQPDGRATREVAIEERFEANGVNFIVVDVPGTMNAASATGEPKADWRMIAAIVNHDRGPHFVKATGPAGSVEHWKGSILAYLKSVQPN